MSTKKLIGYGVGLALVMSLFASAAFAQSYAPLTATSLLEVEAGVTIGDVAGLGQSDLRTTIGQLIRAVLGFLGVVAVVIIIWGGFKWMTSGGADEKVKDARKLIIMGIVGLAIVLSAYAIASFVITSLGSATGLG